MLEFLHRLMKLDAFHQGCHLLDIAIAMINGIRLLLFSGDLHIALVGFANSQRGLELDQFAINSIAGYVSPGHHLCLGIERT